MIFLFLVWHRCRVDDEAPVFPGSLLRNRSRSSLLAIAVATNMAIQFIMLGATGGSAMGASVTIYPLTDGGRHFAARASTLSGYFCICMFAVS